MPVVHVHHVGLEADALGDLRHGACETREATYVVGVPVEVLALVVLVADEGVAHAVRLQGADADGLEAACEGCVDVADPERRRLGAQVAVPRRHHQHLMAKIRQRSRQRACHVPQAARLAVRCYLGAGEQDPHPL